MERERRDHAASRTLDRLLQRIKADPLLQSRLAESDLLLGLKSDNAAIKTNCLIAIGIFRVVDALQAVSPLFSDSDPFIRISAIHCAMKLSSVQVRAQIEEMSQSDSDPNVRQAAEEVLDEHGG